MVDKTEAEAGGGNAISNTVTAHADKIKYIVVAVVVLLAAVLVGVHVHKRGATSKEMEAGNAFFQTIVDTRNDSTADLVASFGEAAQRYQGTSAGKQARVMEFAVAFDAERYDVAERAAQDFIRANPTSPFLNRARLALAQTYLVQDKYAEAEREFRALAVPENVDVFPVAKLGLAQTLEQSAEALRDMPDQYRARLAEAEAEYTDISTRARSANVLLHGFWPPGVVLSSDFSLAMIKDTLAGHELGVPTAMRPPETPVAGEPEAAAAEPGQTAGETEAAAATVDDAQGAVGRAASAAADVSGSAETTGEEESPAPESDDASTENGDE